MPPTVSPCNETWGPSQACGSADGAGPFQLAGEVRIWSGGLGSGRSYQASNLHHMRHDALLRRLLLTPDVGREQA